MRRQPGVLASDSYWTFGGIEQLRSSDQTQALVFAVLSGDEDAVRHTAARLTKLFTRDTDLLVGAGRWRRGGQPSGWRCRRRRDLRRAELLVAPFTILRVVRRVPPAWSLRCCPWRSRWSPCCVHFATFSAASAEITDVSIFAINLASALGLALAIDYSLLIVARYRED